jgi:TIR domain
MSSVFISYVREDQPTAIRLYQDLKSLGADPWIDKYDLVGGQGWWSDSTSSS